MLQNVFNILAVLAAFFASSRFFGFIYGTYMKKVHLLGEENPQSKLARNHWYYRMSWGTAYLIGEHLPDFVKMIIWPISYIGSFMGSQLTRVITGDEKPGTLLVHFGVPVAILLFVAWPPLYWVYLALSIYMVMLIPFVHHKVFGYTLKLPNDYYMVAFSSIGTFVVSTLVLATIATGVIAIWHWVLVILLIMTSAFLKALIAHRQKNPA